MNKKILMVMVLGLFMFGLGSAALTDDIHTYWKLDNNDFSDSVNSNDLINTGTTNITGKISSARDFNGIGNKMNDNDNPMRTSTDGAISFWTKPNAVATQQEFIAAGVTAGSTPYLYIGTDGAGGGNLEFNYNAGDTTRTTTTQMNNGNWYHIVITNDGTLTYYYINGLKQGTDLIAGTGSQWFSDGTFDTFAIGVLDRSTDAGNFNGVIDEIGLWSRNLTQSEVSELYNSGDGLSYPFGATLDSNPIVDLLTPLNNSKQTSTTINFTANITVSEGFNHTNQTLFIWYENGSLFYTETKTEDYNLTIFPEWSTSGFELGMDYTWNILAYGNDSENGTATNNFTFTSSAFSEYLVTYENSVLETNNKQFDLTINSTGVDEITSTLWYNGSSYPALTLDLGDGNYNVIRSIDIPLQNNVGNKSFHWQFDFILVNTNSLQQNSTIYSQEVNQTFFVFCNATYPVEFVNFTTRDAENPFPVQTASLKSAWEWYVTGGTGSVFRNMSYEDVTETQSNFKFCGSPNTTFNINSDIEIDANGFAQNYHYLIDAQFSNDTENINLYLLNDSLATPTTLLVKDKFQNPIEGMLIHIQLYDVGTDTFYTVGMSRTNNNGEDNVYLNWYDSLYKFILIQDGTTILTTNISKVFETPKIFEIPDVTTYSFDKFQDFEFGLSFNDITNIFTLTYVKPSGEVEQGCLRVIKRTSVADTQICLSCSSSTSSTLFCDISTAGNGTFIAAFYGTGSWFMLDWVDIVIGESFAQGINDLLDKDDAAFYTILLIGIILSLFMFNPTLGIIGTILGLLAAGALGFTILTYSLYLGIVIIGGVIIWILKK